MNRIFIHLAIIAALGGSFTQVPALAQAGAGASESHARMEAAFKQLDLKPRQKIEIGKILRNARATGQDKSITLQQIATVLTPEQKNKLMELLKEGRGR